MELRFYLSSSGRNPVADFIVGLSKPDQARFAKIQQSLEAFGFDCPGIQFRQLEGKLWEIKFTGVDGAYRIAYFLLDRETIVLLHAFRKNSQKTSARDLDLARKRLKELSSHEN